MVGKGTRPIDLEVNGKNYTLELGINGIIKLEELLSTDTRVVTFTQVLALMNSGSVKHIRAFLWAALRKHHPDLTLDAVGDLIEDVGGLERLGSQLESLAASATPDPEDVKELGVNAKRPRKARATTRGNGDVFTSMHGV